MERIRPSGFGAIRRRVLRYRLIDVIPTTVQVQYQGFFEEVWMLISEFFRTNGCLAFNFAPMQGAVTFVSLAETSGCVSNVLNTGPGYFTRNYVK